MKKIRRNSKKGFTLVELIVVLVILAILAAMLVPALTGYIDKAKKEKDYQAASVVYAAAQAVITEKYGLGTLGSGTTLAATTTAAGDEVLTLAGVEPSRVTAYSFTFDATTHIITSGNVSITTSGESHTYYLHTDGSWGDAAT